MFWLLFQVLVYAILRNSLDSDSNGDDGKNERAAAWEASFEIRIDDTIRLLVDSGLMLPGNISTKLITKRSKSRSIGTKTNVERLQQAGLLNKGKIKDIDTPQLIAMCLFNSCRAILSKGARQDRAMAIIKSKVSDYFDGQSRAA